MKSFIIRLKDNEHSCKIAKECVEQAEKFNLKVEYFDGILGNDADDIFAADGIIKYPKKLKRPTAGVKGCAASHYLLWKKCIADNEPYLILEHDGYMIRPLPTVDFEDILKLDPHSPFLETYERDVETDQELKILDYKNQGYKPKMAPYGDYFLGAWAYIIKPAAAKILVDVVKENGWVPADKQLGSDLLHLETTSSTVFRIHPLYNFKNIESLSLTRNMTAYTILTSFNETYWREVAQDNVRKMDQLWPVSEKILLYHQLSAIDTSFSNRIQWIDLYQSCPELLEFSDKWKDDLRANGKSEKKNAYRSNAIKFCHKTFAIWHAARQQKTGWLIWLDCDAIILKKIDNDFITKACPNNKCISYLGRKGKYSECGFVGYNLDRPETRKFLELWENFYLSGEFINHAETHDSWTFDYIRKSFDNPTLFCDLNAASITDKNPFANSLIGTHIAHAKGSDKIKTTAKLNKQIK